VVRDGALAIVTIVPCHRDDGTPAISVPLPLPEGFRFAYGPGSFRRHVAIARQAGLAVRVVRDPDLGFDVDVPEDLDALAACV
jgi:2-phospho-L-lactate guanylyltransferase